MARIQNIYMYSGEDTSYSHTTLTRLTAIREVVARTNVSSTRSQLNVCVRIDSPYYLRLFSFPRLSVTDCRAYPS